jgi:hypothetical protein
MVDATRELVLNAADIELVKLSVPAWKDQDGNIIDVYIKQLSGDDAEDYVASTSDGQGGTAQRNAKIIICSVCNSAGEKLFTTNDIAALQGKNSKVLNWLVEEILKINFKTPTEVEDLAKN